MPPAIPELLAASPVAAIGLIGEALAPLVDALDSALPGVDVHHLAAGSLQPDGEVPGGVLPVVRVAARDSATDRLLGAACRRFPDRLWAIVDDDAALPVYLFSFGFRHVSPLRETLDGQALVLYEYRLHDYKQRPDWLNARYWAHPERFDVKHDHND